MADACALAAFDAFAIHHIERGEAAVDRLAMTCLLHGASYLDALVSGDAEAASRALSACAEVAAQIEAARAVIVEQRARMAVARFIEAITRRRRG